VIWPFCKCKVVKKLSNLTFDLGARAAGKSPIICVLNYIYFWILTTGDSLGYHDCQKWRMNVKKVKDTDSDVIAAVCVFITMLMTPHVEYQAEVHNSQI
jgi:hypothetical protein